MWPIALDTLEALDHVFFERVGNQAHLPMGDKSFSVGRNNATRLLAAVLERVQSEIDHVGRLGVAIHAHDRAFFVKLIRHKPGTFP